MLMVSFCNFLFFIIFIFIVYYSRTAKLLGRPWEILDANGIFFVGFFFPNTRGNSRTVKLRGRRWEILYMLLVFSKNARSNSRTVQALRAVYVFLTYTTVAEEVYVLELYVWPSAEYMCSSHILLSQRN
jgi:hypothetical protein